MLPSFHFELVFCDVLVVFAKDSLHQEVSDRRLMCQNTPCVDHRQKVLRYGPNVNQRHLKTRISTHFKCKTTHSKATGLKNVYNSDN